MHRPMPRPTPARTAAALVAFAAAAGAAYAMKRFYSTASAADLRFVLGPTTWLVERCGGYRFAFGPRGYESAELRYLIAPACAGVNFLVVAFSALVLGLVRPWRPAAHNTGILIAAAAAAYASTLLANALRILVAIPLWTHRASWGPLTPERLHEVVGVVIFLGTLSALWLVVRRVAVAPARASLALVPYAGVMLVAPLLRGGWRQPAFWEHAAIVAGTVALAVAASALIRAVAASPGAGGERRPPAPRPPAGTRPAAAPAPSPGR